MKPKPEQFPVHLQRIMDKQGLNSRQLAQRCERRGYPIDRTLITRYLARSDSAKYPSLRHLISLATGLGCSLDELVGYSKPSQR